MCCRICLCHTSDYCNLFDERNCPLRTPKNYEKSLILNNVKETRIEEECVPNQLSFFHCIENISVDITHDVLEGVCQYDISLLLHTIIVVNKYIDLSLLNTRIKAFSYDTYDDNKIPEIPASFIAGNSKIKFSAAEMHIFIKYFGLLIGDKIPRNDKFFKLYHLLNETLKISMTKYYNISLPVYLGCLIAEYLYLRKELYPDSKPKFKHHQMIYYARVMRLMGPLSGL